MKLFFFSPLEKKRRMKSSCLWTLLVSFTGILTAAAPVWKTQDNALFLNNQQVKLRGLSWFGFETQDYVVDGLWSHTMDWYFALLQRLEINSLRVPFSSEWIHYHFDIYPYDGLLSADSPMQHLQSIEILDRFFEKAEAHGIVILLDLHRLHKEYISELWYSPTDDQYTTDTFYATWFAILDRYQDRPNLMGIDLINEPHGAATFGSGDPSTDWRLFVQQALPKISARYPDKQWLFFIEGIEWGHTFRNYPSHPLDLPTALMHRIVFSPHVYGKSVVGSTSSDPNVLHNNWNTDFGFLLDLGYTFVPGEWGGQTYLDADWMNIFVDYLLANNSTSNFLWSLGPNSGDVAGLLLDNWTDLDTFKVDLLRRLVPDPTHFVF
jgi:endoglucanase